MSRRPDRSAMARVPAEGGHVPVLLAEVLAALAPRDGGIYIDGTFGAGGYARAILDKARCRVIALDRDPRAIARGRPMEERSGGRLELVEGRFGEMARLFEERGLDRCDGVALDLGVSSMQIDEPDRGFSFRAEGPLDMRMEGAGATAADLINQAGEAELADVLYKYGDERRSRAIARAIVAARPIATTAELADIVRRVLGHGGERGIDPATRTFQALRIWVNDELGELDRGLSGAEAILSPGARLAVVAFHSLEDRKVKSFLRERGGVCPRVSRHLPGGARTSRAPSFRLIGRAIKPSETEIAGNPRARSARLRVAERTEAPAWGEGAAP
jgi:16S rRNA (cytosine1402-N4)-methyltransferase